ncbi:MAG: transporter related protein [Defluviitaleaceae bacterium]|nr:transporter related protein [Defluviitaleaceae bacterium]
MGERMSKNLSVISDIILDMENVSHTYYDDLGNHVEALKNINLSVFRGEFLSIIGASGCGKTTLLRLIAGLEKPDTGTLILNGEEISEPGPERGYVFQNGALFQWLTIEKILRQDLKHGEFIKSIKILWVIILNL